MLALVEDIEQAPDGGERPFPAEVEFIISAMEAGPRPSHDRHQLRRTPYRVRAVLRLFSDEIESSATVLYTRNVNPKAVGFLTDRRLPLSHGGVVRLPGPDGGVMEAYCTILRCREAAPGWFEGAVYFNRQQACFEAEEMNEGNCRSQSDE